MFCFLAALFITLLFITCKIIIHWRAFVQYFQFQFEVDKKLADTGIVRTFYHVLTQKLKDIFEKKKLFSLSLQWMSCPTFPEICFPGSSFTPRQCIFHLTTLSLPREKPVIFSVRIKNLWVIRVYIMVCFRKGRCWDFRSPLKVCLGARQIHNRQFWDSIYWDTVELPISESDRI